MADEARYPEGVSIFRGDPRLDGSPLLAVDPADWPGLSELLDAVGQDGPGHAAAEWLVAPAMQDQDPALVLSFSSLSPHTHVLVALRSADSEHLTALNAAAGTGHVIITTIAYFETMPDDAPLDPNLAPVVAVSVPTEPIERFLQQP
jgi:hypothetical protein